MFFFVFCFFLCVLLDSDNLFFHSSFFCDFVDNNHTMMTFLKVEHNSGTVLVICKRGKVENIAQ